MSDKTKEQLEEIEEPKEMDTFDLMKFLQESRERREKREALENMAENKSYEEDDDNFNVDEYHRERTLEYAEDRGVDIKPYIDFYSGESLEKLYDLFLFNSYKDIDTDSLVDDFELRKNLFEEANEKNIDLSNYRKETNKWIEVYLKGYKSGIDDYAGVGLNWMQLDEVRLGLENGIDVTEYAHKLVPVRTMRETRYRLIAESNDDEEFLEEYATWKGGNWNIRVLKDPYEIWNKQDVEIYFGEKLAYKFERYDPSFGTYTPLRYLEYTCFPPSRTEELTFNGLQFEDWVRENKGWVSEMFENVGLEYSDESEYVYELYGKLQEWEIWEYTYPEC